MSILLSCLYVGLGGALGALARYALNVLLQSAGVFPLGTLSANLLGCFIMGCIAGFFTGSSWLQDAAPLAEHYRLLFAVGFCGSFTTLSSFVVETSAMLERSEIAAAFAYFFATLGGGFACFWLAVKLTQSLLAQLPPGSS